MAYLLMAPGQFCPHCKNPNYITAITADNIAVIGEALPTAQGFYHCANCGTNFGINASAQVLDNQQNAPVNTFVTNWPASAGGAGGAGGTIVFPDEQNVVLDGNAPSGTLEDNGGSGALGMLGSILNSVRAIFGALGTSIAVAVGSLPASASAVRTTVTAGPIALPLLALNNARAGGLIYNPTTVTAYLGFDALPTLTNYDLPLVPRAYYEIPFNYRGALGVIAPAPCALRVTELS